MSTYKRSRASLNKTISSVCGMLKQYRAQKIIEGVATKKANLRNIFAHCAATRATNQAAKDYRRWFCEVEH